MMKDLFDKFYKNKGPLGKWAEHAEGYFVFQNWKDQLVIVCILWEMKSSHGVLMTIWV